MLITLLTHSQEVQKPSNTGRLVLESLSGLTGSGMPQVRRVIWQRKEADALLLQHIQQYPSALVYPSAAGREEVEPVALRHWIIIDATWQQAQKMLHQSPYLFHLPRLPLVAGRSDYRLRRNQQPGGLCTSETVARILREQAQAVLAERLDTVLCQLQERASLEM